MSLRVSVPKLRLLLWECVSPLKDELFEFDWVEEGDEDLVGDEVSAGEIVSVSVAVFEFDAVSAGVTVALIVGVPNSQTYP